MNFIKEHHLIIDNGYKLGTKIYSNPYFTINKKDEIKWVGCDTGKDDPIDIYIGSYGFSLKEDSFILKNMGLYQLLNAITGSNYERGLNVFELFAKNEYDSWFTYTWKSFVKYLNEKPNWEYGKDAHTSEAYIEGDHVILKYDDVISTVPLDTSTNFDYKNSTNSKTREKVLSKWIKNKFSHDSEYIKYKKTCSETAGEGLSNKLKNEFKSTNVYNFFQIHDFEYFYAKTTINETTILKVPSKNVFDKSINFKDCTFEVRKSQLNILTSFQNLDTGNELQFRNECRYSHGQLNGTPEAKMYVNRNTSLTDLYSPI